MSHKKNKFKIHGPPDRKHQPHPPTVPPDLILPGTPRRTFRYDSLPRGRAQFLVLTLLAIVLGTVLMATKEAPWQTCLPLLIVAVVLGLLFFLLRKNR